jgi:hypothetical protein
MDKFSFALMTVCILATVILPVQAFTVKTMTITIAPDGGAEINIQYELSFFEQSAVFFQIADPAQELKKAFDTNSPEPVTVLEATSSSAVIHVPGFATVRNEEAGSTIVTPTVSFEKAQQVMNGYWFAPLVSPDFSPEVTMVRFPDGYRTVFQDILAVPSISHTIKR